MEFQRYFGAQGVLVKGLGAGLLISGIFSPLMSHADEGREGIRQMAQHLINNHPSSMSAQLNIQARKFNQSAARSALFPVLSMTAAHTVAEKDAVSGTTLPSSFNYDHTTMDLSLSQNLYAGGSTVAEMAKGDALLAGSEHQNEDVMEILSLRAVESHMDILLDRERVVILKNSLDEHRTIAGLVQKRVLIGKEPSSSYAQALSRVALIEAEYELAQGELRSSGAVYKELTGKDAGQLQWPERLLDENWSVVTRLQEYVDNNPGIREAKSALAAAGEDVKIVRADSLPSLDLTLSQRFVNEGDSDYDQNVASSYEDGYQISLNMRWDFELGGGQLHRIDASSKRREIARSNLQDRVKSVREALSVLSSELDSARASKRMRLNHAKEAAAVVKAYAKQYQAGSQNRTLLDLLTVENEHLTALNNALQSRYQELMLQARISRTGGKLVSELSVE